MPSNKVKITVKLRVVPGKLKTTPKAIPTRNGWKFTVDYDIPTGALIDSLGLDCGPIRNEIERLPRKTKGQREIEVELLSSWDINYAISFDDNLKKIRKRGYRPLDVIELLTLYQAVPDIISTPSMAYGGGCLIGLGSKVRHDNYKGLRLYVPLLDTGSIRLCDFYHDLYHSFNVGGYHIEGVEYGVPVIRR